MADRRLPPMDDDVRALLARNKGASPPRAPDDAKARVMAEVEAALAAAPDGAESSDAAGRRLSAASGMHATRSRFSPRIRRAAPWIAAALAPCLVALGVAGARARRRGAAPIEAVPGYGAVCSAASLDGDPHHCGRCGHDCCGGVCAAGVCQPLVVAQGYHPGIAAVDASYVYWPDGSDSLGRIMRVAKGGGEPETLVPGQRRPWSVVVDARFVYWVTNIGVAPYGGVFKAPLGGGAPIAIVPSGEAFANGLLVEDGFLYWSDYGSYPEGRNLLDCADGARIRRAGVDGSNPTTLAASEAGVCTPLLLAKDARRVYWPSRAGHAVQSVDLEGRGEVAHSPSSDPMAVAVDDGHVYWVNWQDGTVERAPKSGGEAVTVATSGEAVGVNGGVGAVDIATDGAHLFWARQGPPWGSGGAIMVAPNAGVHGAAGAVLATSPNPTSLVLDEACVYWVDGSDGKIRAVGKP